MDLDPISSYLRNRGLTPSPRTHLNAHYEGGLRRFLALFAAHGIRATFFVVGRDAQRAENASLLREASARGHEIASHSLTHPMTLASADVSIIQAEIAGAEAAILESTGTRVRGFRAPGWNVCTALFDILRERGYGYDSSLVPWSAMHPLTRLVGHLPGGPSVGIFRGQGALGLHSAWPFPLEARPPRAFVGNGFQAPPLFEIPCGMTSPLPLPLSSTVSALAGDTVAALTERAAAWSRAPTVFVFHALDLVDFDSEIKDHRLASKPGITAPLALKQRRVARILENLGRGRRWLRLVDLLGETKRGAS